MSDNYIYSQYTTHKHKHTQLTLVILTACPMLPVLLRRTEACAARPTEMLVTRSAMHVIASTILENDGATRRTHLLSRHRSKLLALLTHVRTESFMILLQTAQTESMAARASRPDAMEIGVFCRTLVEQKAILVIASHMLAEDDDLILLPLRIAGGQQMNHPVFAKLGKLCKICNRRETGLQFGTSRMQCNLASFICSITKLQFETVRVKHACMKIAKHVLGKTCHLVITPHCFIVMNKCGIFDTCLDTGHEIIMAVCSDNHRTLRTLEKILGKFLLRKIERIAIRLADNRWQHRIHQSLDARLNIIVRLETVREIVHRKTMIQNELLKI